MRTKYLKFQLSMVEKSCTGNGIWLIWYILNEKLYGKDSPKSNEKKGDISVVMDLWCFLPISIGTKTFYNSTNSDARKSYPDMLFPPDSNYLEWDKISNPTSTGSCN